MSQYQFYKSAAMVKMTFVQDEDTATTRDDFEEQQIEIEIVYIPGGDHADGNPKRYWCIKTERWAFSDLNELVALLKKAGVSEKVAETVE